MKSNSDGTAGLCINSKRANVDLLVSWECIDLIQNTDVKMTCKGIWLNRNGKYSSLISRTRLKKESRQRKDITGAIQV